MKIAIPSNDNISVSQHFGRSKGFTVCEIEDNKVVDRKHIANTFTHHAQGGHHEHDHHHEHGNSAHSHEGIFKAIGDCDLVIAGGMGRRLYNDFAERNIQVYVTRETNVTKALEIFLQGNLDNNPDKCCEH